MVGDVTCIPSVLPTGVALQLNFSSPLRDDLFAGNGMLLEQHLLLQFFLLKNRSDLVRLDNVHR